MYIRGNLLFFSDYIERLLSVLHNNSVYRMYDNNLHWSGEEGC